MRKGQRVPREIVETLTRARQQLLEVASRYKDPMYDDPNERLGMVLDCDNAACEIDNLIERWRIPVKQG